MNKNIKHVCFFVTSLPYAGGERVVVDLANSFIEKGIIVDVVCMQNKGGLMRELSPDINCVNLGVSRFSKALLSLGFYMRKQKPDYVLSITPHTHIVSLFAKMLFLVVSTRLVFRVGISYTSMFSQYCSLKDRILKIFVKYGYFFAKYIIAVSEGVLEDLKKNTYTRDKQLYVLYNPKNIELIREKMLQKKGSLFKNKSVFKIMSLGRLRPQKDFETLLEAFALVQKEIPLAELVIVGEGELRATLQHVIDEKKLNVVLVGEKENPYQHMKESDVFVTSSLWEGMPNALIEALVVGTPVVATDCPFGPREVLAPGTFKEDYFLQDGIEYAEAGILVPMKSPKLIAEAVKVLFSYPEKRDRYKKAALERSEYFNKDRIVSEYFGILYPNE